MKKIITSLRVSLATMALYVLNWHMGKEQVWLFTPREVDALWLALTVATPSAPPGGYTSDLARLLSWFSTSSRLAKQMEQPSREVLEEAHKKVEELRAPKASRKLREKHKL